MRHVPFCSCISTVDDVPAEMFILQKDITLHMRIVAEFQL